MQSRENSGLYIVDGSFSLIDCSPTLLNPLGKSLQEVRDAKCYKLLQERDTPCNGCIAQRAVRNGCSASGTMRFSGNGHPATCFKATAHLLEHCTDGTRVAVVLEADPESPATESSCESSNRITLQKEIYEELLHEKEMHDLLINSAPNYIVLIDTQGRIQLFNLACQQIMGISSDQVIGKHCTEVLLGVTERTQIGDLISQALSGQLTEYVELNINTPCGIRCVAWKNNFLRDTKGELLGILCMGLDITEQKDLESQLLQAQKMESIGKLAGGIAHDFNNLLGGILGYSSFAKTQVPENSDLYTYLTTIEQSAMRASQLTQQLLTFARKGTRKAEILNFNIIANQTIELFRRGCGSGSKIKIITKISENTPMIKTDPIQMEQMLLNILINSRDAMPAGGTITFSTICMPPGQLRLQSAPALRDVAHLKISITDTGAGMTEEVMKHIYEPFFTTKDTGKGTGLGLSMVYGIVKTHDGIIECRSKPDQGTTFDIYFPMIEQITHASETGQLGAIAAGNETILLVDDEDIIRRLVKDMLEKRGYTVITASQGKEAIELYNQRSDAIDLVILDIMMPVMDGTEIFRHLKSRNPSIKCIIVSGYSKEGIPQKILDAGATAFVQKPFRLPMLSAMIRSVLDN